VPVTLLHLYTGGTYPRGKQSNDGHCGLSRMIAILHGTYHSLFGRRIASKWPLQWTISRNIGTSGGVFSTTSGGALMIRRFRCSPDAGHTFFVRMSEVLYPSSFVICRIISDYWGHTKHFRVRAMSSEWTSLSM